MRWVRPDFTSVANSSALASSEVASTSSSGWRSSATAIDAATWMEVGKVSLLDWLALTWSWACTSTPARDASEASTSFMFMFELVPEPVWKTSSGNWSSWSPDMTTAAASLIAPACSSLITPSSAFTVAAAGLTAARAWMCRDSSVVPEIGKFSTARWVCARQRAWAGTWTSPMESRSVRNSASARWGSPLMASRLLARRVQPVLLLALAQPDVVRRRGGVAEDRLHRGLELWRLGCRPDHEHLRGRPVRGLQEGLLV